MQAAALLLQLPSPFDSVPSSGFDAIGQMNDKMTTIAWVLFGLAAVIGGGIVVSGLIANLQISPHEFLLRLVLIGCLLVTFKFVFFSIAGLGIEASYEILTKQDQDAVTQSIENAAPKEGTAGSSVIGWLTGIVTFLLNFNLNPGVGLTGLVIALADLLFFISLIFMGLLYLALMIIAYITGPLVIALGAIPRWGNRLLATWVGTMVQLSVWPIWFALVAWFILVTNKVFLVSNSTNLLSLDTTSQNIESAVLALLLALMNFATPFIINMVLPVSRTSQLGQYAWGVASAKMSSMVGGAVRMAGMAAGGLAGGAGGAAAGSSASGDATQRISAPVTAGSSGASSAATGTTGD